ncbi:GNAT family N-acetyltransferase [Marinovum sp. 2_MG-2023]|uniref:GNAT family N-acetyltransferase n=1 Tax=unclassified Marinovum TaxID=2647166 RepID=UPI0026E48A2C|nr:MULTISPECIES: GNAT family N-acetyltransferase [unclassified Marinovum]MDO6728640.1 GNAT family N-acetyltransferase [Marinovum sp. 2_MG-2023]MDO6777944.1 GNAT family N-acetyltransferase [Marinovum sp. 1_MG-2023]
MTVLSVDIPVIETERLILRAPQESDFEAHATFMASDRSHFIGGPTDRYQAWRGFSSALGHWMLRGYGGWTMTLQSDGTPVGRSGYIFGEGWQEPEIGWHVYGAFEGKGYVFEAAEAILKIGPAKFGLDKVISYIDPANTRSAALAERLGAVLECKSELLGKPCNIYRHRSYAGGE